MPAPWRCRLKLEVQSVAEQFGNPFALGIVLVLRDSFALERLAVEITTQHEGAIVFDLVPIESEESMLGLEVTKLQEAIDLGMQARPAAGERQFGEVAPI